MNEFGFEWPSSIGCDQFTNEQPCVKGSLVDASNIDIQDLQ